MSKGKVFRVELHCSDPMWWHYNVELLCEALDEQGVRVGFISTVSTIAEVGANLTEHDRHADHPRPIILTTPACDHAQLFLYLIPHTLPESNAVADGSSFSVELQLFCDDRPLRTEQHEANRWGGASIALHLP